MQLLILIDRYILQKIISCYLWNTGLKTGFSPPKTLSYPEGSVPKLYSFTKQPLYFSKKFPLTFFSTKNTFLNVCFGYLLPICLKTYVFLNFFANFPCLTYIFPQIFLSPTKCSKWLFILSRSLRERKMNLMLVKIMILYQSLKKVPDQVRRLHKWVSSCARGATSPVCLSAQAKQTLHPPSKIKVLFHRS